MSSQPPPVGFGVGCISHLVPFHRCAMVSGVPEPCEYPSAVQAEEDWQVTANRKSPRAPVGLGVGWVLHAEPFHRSAIVTKSPALVT
jgi:hypothetical protein